MSPLAQTHRLIAGPFPYLSAGRSHRPSLTELSSCFEPLDATTLVQPWILLMRIPAGVEDSPHAAAPKSAEHMTATITRARIVEPIALQSGTRQCMGTALSPAPILSRATTQCSSDFLRLVSRSLRSTHNGNC